MPRGLIREPTVWLNVLSAALTVLVTFGFKGLSPEQSALITAAVGAGIGVVNALVVRPVAPAAFTGFVGALAALLAAYGLHVSQEMVGAVQALVVTVLALQARQQVTPVADPRPAEQVVG
jgi:hypothetical protein